ncbi:MAG: transposase [Porticoccaceae bacterium]
MTRPRKELISLEDTPYYHCVSRCVRGAFLCGSGENYDFEHRRGWIVQRIKRLAAVFAIDVAAYAVMSNHYHLVLRIDSELCQKLGRDQVIQRWRRLFAGPALIQAYASGRALSAPELAVVDEIVETWRQRLGDISWFMRCLNEHIARLANREDGCTGRFWEGRFKSQALLDDRALISCMAYVDLNPIRAGIASCPEGSDYTSLQERLGIAPEAHSMMPPDPGSDRVDVRNAPIAALDLLPFVDQGGGQQPCIPFDFLDYIQLVDWTGRALRDDRRAAIDSELPDILSRLRIAPGVWLGTCCHVEERFGRAMGSVSKINALCERIGQRWIQGVSHCRELYSQRLT